MASTLAATVRVTGAVEPVPAWSARYDELHATYRALYPALRPLLTPATT